MSALSSLPTSAQLPPAPNDLALANHLFAPAEASLNKDAMGGILREICIVSGLTGIVLLPIADDLIIKFLPSAKDSPYLMIAAKMAVVAVLYFVMTRMGYIRH